MNNLKQLFTMIECADFEQRFNCISHELFFHFAISTKYGMFLFKDIEFYFYNSTHRDIITHPRNSEPLTWYINDFGGIDLNFSSSIKRVDSSPISKYVLDDAAYFGGILIRQLISVDGKTVLSSPLKVAELFRSFDAIEIDGNFPKLIRLSSDGELLEPQKRVNLIAKEDNETIKKKVQNILYSYDKDASLFPNDMEQDFQNFVAAKYRFIRK